MMESRYSILCLIRNGTNDFSIGEHKRLLTNSKLNGSVHVTITLYITKAKNVKLTFTSLCFLFYSFAYKLA